MGYHGEVVLHINTTPYNKYDVKAHAEGEMRSCGKNSLTLGMIQVKNLIFLFVKLEKLLYTSIGFLKFISFDLQ